MGIFPASGRFLLAARGRGVNFTRTLTFGRQHFFVEPDLLRKIMADFDMHSVPELKSWDWAEPFFHALGAKEITAIDASPYQEATILQDMNDPIPAELYSRFDTVFDGGTLEHIFNLPQAIKNLMQMTAIGGHILVAAPLNNFPGHAFYQLSAELFYRVFSPENGFQIERVIACEGSDDSPWFEVPDVKEIRQKVEFSNCIAALVMVQARRIADVPIFAKWPQQSDYVNKWAGEKVGDDPPSVGLTGKLFKPVPWS